MNLRLGDVATFINGGAWTQSEYAESGIPVVRVTDCKDGSVDLSGCKFLSPSCYENYKKHELYKGDLIIATVGSHPNQPGSVVGRPIIIPLSAEGALLNQNAVCIRPSNNKLNKRYLAYVGLSRFFREYIIAHARGTANQVRMAIGLLEEMQVPIPTAIIQEKVATILSAYDDLVENNLRRIKILEEIAQNLYHEWFVKFRFPGHEDVRFVDSSHGRIPEGWEVVPLGNLIELKKEKFKEELHSECPLLDLAKMQQRTLYVGETGNPNELKTSRIIFEEDDILFGSIRPYLHKVALAPYRGVTNISVLVIRPVEEILQSFLSVFLSSKDAIRWADQHSTGTKMPVIKWETLQTMPVLLPSRAVLRFFLTFVRPMLQTVKMASSHNRNLRRTRDLLLPKLISGEVDVSELDITIPEEVAA